MAGDYRYRPPSPIVKFSDEENAKIQAKAEHIIYVRVFDGRMKMGCFELGRDINRAFELKGRVEVREHGYGKYSAKLYDQMDCDIVTQTSFWRIFDRYSIEVYKWQPNFQFSEVVPVFVNGDMVEARLDNGLPVEYWTDDVLTKIGNTVCEPLGCEIFMVDTSIGKPARFWFRLVKNCCLDDLPLHVRIDSGDGPVLVGLAYSRAQTCYCCGRIGHIRRTCPELNKRTRSPNRATRPALNQWTRSSPNLATRPELNKRTRSPNRATRPELNQWTRSSPNLATRPELNQRTRSPNRPTPSNSVPTQVNRPHSDQEPVTVPVADPVVSLLEPTCLERHEETSPPFTPKEFFDRCSGSISPSRPIEETEMGPKGAMLVENGEERKPKCYNLGEDVSEIHVTVNVTQLNNQKGNQRRVIITPRAGHACRYSKKILYTSIEDVDGSSIRELKDTCDGNHISLAIVLDKSSLLANDDRIVRRFGFTDSQFVKMTFPIFGSDGSVMDVKGNCLLMWKREKLRVNVSPVSYGNTSQHLEFNASWLVGESDDSSSGEEDESPHGFSSSGEEDLSDSSVSSSGDESSVFPSNGNTYSAGSSFFSAAGEELPNDESVSTLSSIGVAFADSEETSLFSTSGDQGSNISSASSRSSSESSVFLPNGATHSEESSLFSTDAEDISNISSAPSSSEEGDESFVLIRNGDWD